MKKYLVFAFVGICLTWSQFIYAATVAVGRGSYTDVLPSGKKAPPTTMFITSNITGPIPTTKWYSSVVSSQYSYNQYGYPLTFYVRQRSSESPQKTTLEIGYPVYSESSSTCRWAHNKDIEIRAVIGDHQLNADDVRLDGYSDWTATVKYQDKTTSDYFKATYGHGLVYVYFEFSSSVNPVIYFHNTSSLKFFDDNGTTVSADFTGDHIGLLHNNRYYGVFAPAGSQFVFGTDGSYKTLTINLPPDERYLSIGVMTAQGDLNYFYNHAYAFVTDTQVSWSYNQTTQDVSGNFTVTCESKQYGQDKTILALLPHQWKNSTNSYLSYTYKTLLNTMKTIEGNSFVVVNKFHGVLPFLPDKGDYSKVHLKELLDNEKSTSLSKTDSYFNGKQVAKVANLIPIAEQLQETSTKQYLIDELKSTLIDWFTYSSDESSRFFYYDNLWKGLIAYDNLFYGYNYTDHHFHDGYFVYAAALLGLYDSSFVTDYGDFVKYLIKDYANWNRGESLFPFLRTFDPYMGHSYCDGLAQFTDGNNQESSSEAMNAWAAIILWGMVTGDNTIRDLGIWGYTTEYSAIHDYYFNIDQDIYGSSYTHATVGILWDGKAVYATWFSAQDEAIHGIQWIPSTASMLYLGYYPDYCQRNYNSFFTSNGGQEDYNGWYDIIWKYQCFYDPLAVIGKYNENTSIDTDGDSFTFLHHWIYNFNVLGKIDISYYANTPYHAVFDKNGTKYYIAYNSTSSMQKVSFYNAGGYLGDIFVRAKSIACYKGFAPTVNTVNASSFNNTGISSITINGSGFVNGTTVKLTKSGQNDIVATNIQVTSGTKIECNLNLTNVAPGDWSLIVINPDSDAEGMLPTNFTVIGNAPTITRITPSSAAKVSQVNVSITGNNFYNGIMIKLTKNGQQDLEATNINLIDANTLTCRFNLSQAEQGNWNLVIINTDNQTVTLSNGFNITISDNTFVHPNPCNLIKGDKVTFANVCDKAHLKIYSITGELIFEENQITTGSYVWDGTNKSGHRVSSGIYIYIVENGNTRKKGKIAIIK